MRVAAGVFCGLALLAAGAVARAAECPGNPDAIGVSRTIAIDPAEHPLLGTIQYRETLPLNEREVVLTFDDGPLPPYSDQILDILAKECVRATYFMVGRMARAYPEHVRATFRAGHTIGTHSHSHPFTFHEMPLASAEAEIENGIAAVGAALGDRSLVAPFFRIPGLLRRASVEHSLTIRGIVTWSADFPGDDWRGISAAEVTRRSISRLEEKGKGILLLHDIKPVTVEAVAMILRELKERGYRIVHVVPATAELPKTATTPEQWVLRPSRVDDRQVADLRRISVAYTGIYAATLAIAGLRPEAPYLAPSTLARFPSSDHTGSIRPRRPRAPKPPEQPGFLAFLSSLGLRGSTN